MKVRIEIDTWVIDADAAIDLEADLSELACEATGNVVGARWSEIEEDA